MIKGGYYLKARCIQNSEIAIMPPYVREIWDWLLKEANHSDQISNGTKIERGQVIRTFKDIQNGLLWMVGWRKMTYKKWQCENAMKLLKKADMITTTKTTRGMSIIIKKYKEYQNPSNYESNSDSRMRATDPKQTTDTINKNVKNDNNDKKTDNDIVSNHKDKKTSKDNIITEDFNVFWKEYPKKVGKDKALESWIKRKPPLDKCLETLRWQKTSAQWIEKNGRFIPMPTTWLNQGRWNDEPLQVYNTGNGAAPIPGKYATALANKKLEESKKNGITTGND